MKLCGTVIRGHGRGADLSFPTANLEIADTDSIPSAGVYAGFATMNRAAAKRYIAAIHIGPRPTFDEDDPSVEAHLLDFSGDLYGQTLCLDIRHKLREIEKFDTIDALRAALVSDCEHTRELLDN